jgi:DNA-binding CsgD family transcriptional regulator
LLRGDGEKQIAARLKLSTHTVHVYVKALHKRYNVSSRSELLAHFIPHANGS